MFVVLLVIDPTSHELETPANPVRFNMTVKPDANKDWDDIGEVNDVILSRDGAVKAVVLGVGGFLGMGEKDVAIPMESVKFVKEDNDAGDYFLVVNSNKQMLTDAPAYKAPMEKADASMAARSDATVNSAAAPQGGPMLVRPEITREGYRNAETAELTSETLTGASVYGANDEDIGDVEKLILNGDGSVKQMVLDIGGFLGMGEHRIAVNLDQVSIVRNENGDNVRVYIDATQETLKAQPAYNEG